LLPSKSGATSSAIPTAAAVIEYESTKCSNREMDESITCLETLGLIATDATALTTFNGPPGTLRFENVCLTFIGKELLARLEMLLDMSTMDVKLLETVYSTRKEDVDRIILEFFRYSK